MRRPRNEPPAYQEYLRFVMDEELFNMPALFSDCDDANALEFATLADPKLERPLT